MDGTVSSIKGVGSSIAGDGSGDVVRRLIVA